MREIKFRAWDKANNSWLEGVTYTLHTSGRLITWPPDVELMQFTGLKDKHGKEIYEGDIVERVFLHPVKGPYKQQAKVIWSGARWWLEHLDIKPDGRIQADWLENRWVMDCEIIGTIYDNPDLLK